MKRLFFSISFVCTFIYVYAQQIDLVVQEKNLGSITVLSYNSEGTLLASGSEGDNSIKIWNVRSGRVVGVLTGHESHIIDLDFHPNGKELVSADKEGSVFVWNLIDWKFKDSLSYEHPILCVRYSKSGDYILGGGENKAVLAWNLADNNSVKLLGEHQDEVVQLSVDPTTGIWASGSITGDVKLWSSDLQFLRENRLHKRKLSGLKFTNNGLTLVSSAGDGDVIFWNTETLTSKNELHAHNKPILAFDLNEQSGLLVSSSEDKTLKIWNLNDLSLHHAFDNSKAVSVESEIHEPIQTLTLSPDGYSLATSSYKVALLSHHIKSEDNLIRVWNLQRKELYKTLEGKATEISAFAFHPEKNQVITLTSGNRVTLWDLDKAENLWSDTLQPAKVHVVKNDAFEEEKLKKGFKKFLDGDLSVDDIDVKGTVEKKAVSTLKRIVKDKPTIRYSSKGKYLITSMPKDEVRIYEVKENGNLEYLKYVNHHQEYVYDLLTDKSEKYLFCLGAGNEAISVIDLETGKLKSKLPTSPSSELQNLGYFFEGQSLSLSPDGKYLAASFVTGKTFVYNTQTLSMVFENELPPDLKVKLAKGAFSNFTEDGSKLAINNQHDGIHIYSVPGFSEIPQQKINVEGIGLNVTRPSQFAIFKTAERLQFTSLNQEKSTQSSDFTTDWITDIALNHKNLLGVSLRTGEFKFIDPSTGKDIISLIGEDDNYIFKTSENYYKVSKDGYNLVTFRIGQSAYPFEQFDLIYNRPHKVLEALKCEDQQLIQLYAKAYEKRLNKLSISLESLGKDVHIPEVKLVNRNEIPLFTNDTSVVLNLKAIDDKLNLSALKIWINNVPVYGRSGKQISGKAWQDKITVPLGAGLNKIQISVVNEKMIESLYEFIEVDVQISVKPNLYLLAIGTSEFSDNRYNLRYAAKDAHDLVNLFNQESSVYKKVYYKSLTNEDVIKDNFLALKDFVKNAGINDVIIVFLAGHGLLSSELDYFYATHDIDFTKPQEKGIEYTQIEYILENILVLRKILIMDTCHSGEVDKDDISYASSMTNDEDQEGDVDFRNVGPALTENKVSPSKLSKELFVDVRKGTGATVISSAGGAEFAMESGEWKNGLFTYCLLNGLTNRTADLNKDGAIYLSELQEYLKERVGRLSHGRQVPTTRTLNYSTDYLVW